MIRRELFTQIDRDSARLGVLDSILHRMDEPGEYELAVRSDHANRTVAVTVDRDSVVEQVEIDLAADGAGCGCGDAPAGPVVLAPGGHLALHVSGGSERYSALMRAAGADKAEFDTRRLSPGDQVAMTLLRPGSYRVRAGDAEGKLVVTYPVRGREPYRPGPAVRVVARGGRLEPETVEVGPAQPVVFELTAGGRVVVDLVEADDRPRDVRRPPGAPRVTVRHRRGAPPG